MPKNPRSKETNVAIIVAAIGLAGTVIAALLGSPLLTRLAEKPTPTVTVVSPENSTLVFNADFEDSNTTGFGFFSGDWKLAKDRSNNVLETDASTLGPDDYAIAFFGPTDFSNGVIELKVKFEQTVSLYVIFRLQQGSKYMLYLNGEHAILGFDGSSLDEVFTPLLDNTTRYLSPALDVWYTIRIEAQGNQFTVFMDGNKLFTGADNHIQSGSLQFMVGSGIVMFDDIKVWSVEQ